MFGMESTMHFGPIPWGMVVKDVFVYGIRVGKIRAVICTPSMIFIVYSTK